MPKSTQAIQAEKLRKRGFDESYVHTDEDKNKSVRVKCSQCAALVLNGVACHERGCPNNKKSRNRWDEDDDY